jgi:prefoldin subunit 5
MKELVEVLETVARVTKYNNNRIVKLEQQTEKIIDEINKLRQQIKELKRLIDQGGKKDENTNFKR